MATVLLYGFIPAIILVVVGFVVALMMAPVQIWKEQQDKIAALEQEKDEEKTRMKAEQESAIATLERERDEHAEKARTVAQERDRLREKGTNTDWVEHGVFQFEYDVNAQWSGQTPDITIDCAFQENHSGEYSVVFSPRATLVYELAITEKRRNGFKVHVGYSGLMALDDPEQVEVTWQAVGKG